MSAFVHGKDDEVMGEQVRVSRPSLDAIVPSRSLRKTFRLIFTFASLDESFVKETAEEVSSGTNFYVEPFGFQIFEEKIDDAIIEEMPRHERLEIPSRHDEPPGTFLWIFHVLVIVFDLPPIKVVLFVVLVDGSEE